MGPFPETVTAGIILLPFITKQNHTQGSNSKKGMRDDFG
jgi:hypothetical protein